MGLLRVIKGKYENRDAVKYVIRYITRTRPNEDRGMELIAAGSLGTSETSERMIEDFLRVQKCLRSPGRIGKKINHEVFLLTVEETEQLGYPGKVQYLYWASQECARFFYEKGFQVVFAIHTDMEKGVHIHFAVNTVNYMNGKKWSCGEREMKERETLFQIIIRKYQQIAAGCYSSLDAVKPIKFYDKSWNMNIRNACYYVSVGGKIEGIFDNWKECDLRTGGNPGTHYRKFPSIELALCYMSNEVSQYKNYVVSLGAIEQFFDNYDLFMDCLENMVQKMKRAYQMLGINKRVV